MTRTFNAEFYGQLLAKYQPKAITTESENEQAIAVAQDLEHRPNRTPEEDTFLELLVALIEKFEETHYPIPKGTPHSMLIHLMEARDMQPEGLVGVLGSLELVLDIINGKISISQHQAKALAEVFKVDESLFV
ncbi:MAG: transcriptional regulator [Scytonematopsis contorta HA4267-MV1]|jgi:HTH-type transcriptional regulator/antitoxin HigA|nr:transcriptional regulator [Scytonematopsis contorta HA4267-MV1]